MQLIFQHDIVKVGSKLNNHRRYTYRGLFSETGSASKGTLKDDLPVDTTGTSFKAIDIQMVQSDDDKQFFANRNAVVMDTKHIQNTNIQTYQ